MINIFFCRLTLKEFLSYIRFLYFKAAFIEAFERLVHNVFISQLAFFLYFTFLQVKFTFDAHANDFSLIRFVLEISRLTEQLKT